jgi:hypothetical protein
MILKTPQDLLDNNLEVVGSKTLLNTYDYSRSRALLEEWCARLPGLHTPFKPRGQGGIPPKEHQLMYASLGLCRRHNFLSWTMGVGKTLTAILHILGWYGDQLFYKTDWESAKKLNEIGHQAVVKKGLMFAESNLPPGSIQVLAPKHTLNHVWMEHLKMVGISHLAEVIESESQVHNSTAPIWIYHFDFLKQQTHDGKVMKTKSLGFRIKDDGEGTYFLGKQMYKLIAKKRPPSFMIVDEVHRLRSGSDRTRVVSHLRTKAKRVLGLSGTPMDGWVEHLGTILEFIYGPNTPAFPFTSKEFANKFTRTKVVTTDIATGGETVGRERPVPGVSQLQIPNFIKIIKPLMHRLNLSDPEVKGNVVFPPANFHRVLVSMDLDQQVFYDSLHLSGKRQLENMVFKGGNKAAQRKNMLELITNLRLASSAPTALDYSGPIAKIDAIITIAEKFKAEGRKLLIYTNFIEEGRIIHQKLNAAGIVTARLYASDPTVKPKMMSQAAREEVLEYFQEDPNVVCLVASLELVSEGLTLTEASGIVRPSRPWRAALDWQGLARAIRPGQVHTHVDVYDLVNDGTIDIYIEQLLNAKITATSAFIDRDFSKQDDLQNASLDPFELAEMLSNA